MRYAGVIALSTLPTVGPAAPRSPGTWERGAWTAAAAGVDTGEDYRVTCQIRTGGDGDPVLMATITNGDATPPDAWPMMTLVEWAPRGHATLMQNGDRVRLTFDDGFALAMEATAGVDDGGIPVAVATIDERFAPTILSAMRRSLTVAAQVGDTPLRTFSLRGFTAAYGRMAEACGFSMIGVD
jgi:hypothetical protein